MEQNTANNNEETTEENNENKSKNYGIFGSFLKGVVKGASTISNITQGINTAKETVKDAFGKTAFGDIYTNMKNTISDKTNENLGTEIVKPLNFWEEMRKVRDEEWAREDAIRAETQAREDTAFSRTIEDLRRSGVNINLLGNINPAASGGGITNQTGSMDYTMSEAEYNKAYEMLMQEIELNFKGDQAEKDRIMNLIKALITGGSILGGAALKK